MVAFRHTTCACSRRRRGFTLIELIVVMAIMAIIAVMLMFALKAAAENAKATKTKGMITKINELFMERWASYETRRVIFVGEQPSGEDQQEAHLRRLEGLRDLMRMEFPQRWKDVTTEPISGVARPAASANYKRRYERIRDNGDLATFQGAECLYMILTTAVGGHGSARENFQESEIGDVDGDGLFEFLDAWGQPIMFLRWAPAFDSPKQKEARDDPAKSPDPWDPFDADKRTTYALFPLIFSSGHDREYDIRRKTGGAKLNDPFDGDYSRVGEPESQDRVGEKGDPNGSKNHYDNIHNH